MIRVLLFNKTSNEVISGGIELVSAWQQNNDSCIWLDTADEPVDEETRFLQDTFDLHLMAIQDAQRKRHPPKLEAFTEFTFILLKSLSEESEELHFSTNQLALFLGERFLVTRSSSESPVTDLLFKRAARNSELLSRGPASLGLRLCRMTVERYLKILLHLEPRLEELEAEVMQHPDDSILAELLNYKTELKKFRRVFLYHQQIFHELKSGAFPAIEPEREHEIIDVYEQLERASSLASLYYELATDLADGYISVTSHRLNQIMKVLTVVMAIFVPLSFLAGIYGMNFENMPELHSESGYYILLFLMIAIVVTLLTVFRMKKWL
ncbi:MAG: magnesium/cobalt transporter CorA [Gammaproteobacteria bacterium]